MELKYKVKKEYLWVEFSGKRTPGKEVEEAFDIWKKVADLCEKNNLKRIMVISKVEGRLPALSAFNLSESLSKMGWKKDYKLAGVAFDDVLFVNLQLLETMVQNFGYECKMFKTAKAAKKWLLDSQ